MKSDYFDGEQVCETMWAVVDSNMETKSFLSSIGTDRTGETYYIYHCSINTHLPPAGVSHQTQQHNVAIVSLRQADHVRVIRMDTALRPVLCIGFGGPRTAQPRQLNFYCSTHSNNQFNQAFRTVLNTESALEVIGRTVRIPVSWMIMGDFNRMPDNLVARIEQETRERGNPIRTYNRWVIAPTNGRGQLMLTQRSGNTLDYAVVGSSRGEMPPMIAQVESGTSQVSDHNLVRFYPVSLVPSNTPRPDPRVPQESSNTFTWLGATAFAAWVASFALGSS